VIFPDFWTYGNETWGWDFCPMDKLPRLVIYCLNFHKLRDANSVIRIRVCCVDGNKTLNPLIGSSKVGPQMIHVWDHFDHTNDVTWWKSQGWPLIKVLNFTNIQASKRSQVYCLYRVSQAFTLINLSLISTSTTQRLWSAHAIHPNKRPSPSVYQPISLHILQPERSLYI
jgi:hypothetical protein